MKAPEGLWGVAVTAGGSLELGPMIGGVGLSANTGFAFAGDGTQKCPGWGKNWDSHDFQVLLGTAVLGRERGQNYRSFLEIELSKMHCW